MGPGNWTFLPPDRVSLPTQTRMALNSQIICLLLPTVLGVKAFATTTWLFLINFFLNELFKIYFYECFAFKRVCAHCICLLDHLELVLQVVVSHHWGAGIPTWVFSKNKKNGLNSSSVSLATNFSWYRVVCIPDWPETTQGKWPWICVLLAPTSWITVVVSDDGPQVKPEFIC